MFRRNTHNTAYTGFGPRSPQTPQTEPIPYSNQVPNHAGGYSFQVDDVTRLKRFLILGSVGGTFYVGERKLTKENLEAVDRLIASGEGHAVVQAIAHVSQAGRAASNDPALFVLARCIAPDVPLGVRRAAFEALPSVARTGTHLLHFVQFAKQFRGWGRAYKRAVAGWFNNRKEHHLAYQVVKYQSRDGYSQRDLLRLAHPKAETDTYNAIYRWVTKGWDAEAVGEVPYPDPALHILWAFERAKRATDDKEVARLVKEYRLPREAVPTQFLHSVRVWEALLEEMPLEALTRNLATMTREGVIKPMGDTAKTIALRLSDKETLRRARLHPLKLLVALKTYESGKSVKGDATWTPVREIIDALSRAFYLAFDTVEPCDKKTLLCIDTSGSMSYYGYASQIQGMPNLSLHEAAGAMAMVTARRSYSIQQGVTIPNYHIIGLDTQVHELLISPAQRLDDIVRTLGQYQGGGTNLALPMLYALQRKLMVDAFVIYTDSETWAGSIHPSQALALYRQQMNPQARIVNVQMTTTHVTNNDPRDPLALEVVGFDTSAPEIISAFVRGEF